MAKHKIVHGRHIPGNLIGKMHYGPRGSYWTISRLMKKYGVSKTSVCYHLAKYRRENASKGI